MVRIPLPGPVATLAFALLATCDVARSQCLTVIKAFDGDTDNGFGHAADMQGSLTAIGAPYDDVMGQWSGSVYVQDVVTGQTYYKRAAASGQANELFGYEVAIGQGILAVGAPGIAGQWGPTRVYDLVTGTLLSELHPSLPAELFGFSLAVDSGLVVAGDYGAETAHVYDALTGTELYALQDPTGASDTSFGWSVAIAANRVVVGAPVAENEWGGRGVVYVYDATTGTLLYHLEREEHAPFFGWGIDTTGGTLVVGSNERLNLYDIATGAHLAELDAPNSSEIAVEGGEAVVSDGWAPVCYVVSLADGKVEYTLKGLHPTVSLAMGAGRWLVSHPGGGYGEAAYLWDAVDSDGDGFSDCLDVGTSTCGPANPNSTGASGWIAAGGSPYVVQNDLRVRAGSLPLNKAGYFLVSRTQGFVPFAGGSQGNLCLAGQIGRFADQVKSSGGNGRFTIQVDLTAIPPGMQTVLPGEDWNFQCWYRDVNPNPTSNFTDAVNILFQ